MAEESGAGGTPPDDEDVTDGEESEPSAESAADPESTRKTDGERRSEGPGTDGERRSEDSMTAGERLSRGAPGATGDADDGPDAASGDPDGEFDRPIGATPEDASAGESEADPDVDAETGTGEDADTGDVADDAGGSAGEKGPLQRAAEREEPEPASTASAEQPSGSAAAATGERARQGGPTAGEDTGLDDLSPKGPPDDEEMPLADHIEEMIKRLAIVSAVAAVVAAVVFFFEPVAENTIMFIWNSVLPAEESARPRVYGPLELLLTELKFASLAGFVMALPMFVYQTYRFMRPGLYPHERRYYLAAVPTSLVLAFVGVSFSFYVVLPGIFNYFHYYSKDAGQIAFALRQTFDLILVLMGYMALVFQIPLFIMLAIMMGLTSRTWLEGRRLYFWGGFLGVSYLFIPEPTGVAPLVVALTMVGLFEGTLALLRWTGN